MGKYRTTQGLLCASSPGSVMILVRDYDILPKEELHARGWVKSWELQCFRALGWRKISSINSINILQRRRELKVGLKSQAPLGYKCTLPPSTRRAVMFKGVPDAFALEADTFKVI